MAETETQSVVQQQGNQSALMRKKATIKGKLTRYSKFINELSLKYDANGVLSKADQIKLRLRMSDSSNLLSSFEEVTSEMLFDDSQENEIENFENLFFDLNVAAERMLETCDSIESRKDGNNSFDEKCNKEVTLLNQNIVKLPDISLPKFRGDSSNWICFRDLFSTLIDKNETLTPAVKMHYLVTSLEGSAREVLGGLQISDMNYEIAKSALFERFDNNRSLVVYHVRELFNLNEITRENSKDLRALIDSVKGNLRSLDSLLSCEEKLEAILIFLFQQRLDTRIVKEFESQFSMDKFPKVSDFLSFLERRASLLEAIEKRGDSSSNKNKTSTQRVCKSFPAQTNVNCVLCNGSHAIYKCAQFEGLDVTSRFERVKQLRLCLRCLAKGHTRNFCRVRIGCSICKSKGHHTLLHMKREIPVENVKSDASSTQESSNSPTVNVTAFASNTQSVLLPTASVVVFDVNGNSHRAKALLDSGSMSSFVSTRLCEKLKLPKKVTNIQVRGITDSAKDVNMCCDLKIHSSSTNFALKTNCLIIPKITSSLPAFSVSVDKLNIPCNITLADPDFGIPSEIDILIGANHFWELLLPGQQRLGKNRPILQNTQFGYLVSGTIPYVSTYSESLLCTTSSIDKSLAKFWQLEEIPSKQPWSIEEKECERHFVENTTRDDTGKFVVRIPFKSPPENLGRSREQAASRFYNLEKKFDSNSEFKDRYVSFMNQYESSNHMSVVEEPIDEKQGFYLPHHGVIKEDSVTTKLRTVFDGSARTTNGVCLNGIQMIGPVIQSDLFSVLLRFRKYPFVFSTDVEKMYRQVWVSEEDRKYQRILWRPNRDSKLKTYELNTVTYGTASASFLATRCLVELGKDCEASNPTVSRIINKDFYMDDCLSGAFTLEETQKICVDLNKILSSAGFPLKKWLSNVPEVLSGVEANDKHPHLLAFDSSAKTLGLLWSYSCDSLMFSISECSKGIITKRSILSEISQIFDILGLISPCIVKAKMLLQAVWLEKLSWDSALPSSLQEDWRSIKIQLPELKRINFPRHVVCENPKSVTLHAFCDASLKGYGACVYLRSVTLDGQIICNLLCAKGKVSPLKVLTIPRLELLGALTLVRLVNQVILALEMELDDLYFWTDSSIVLGWIKMQPNKLCTFVANRVAEIQELSASAKWRHVDTKSNPADLISRGMLPSELIDSNLWKNGPDWLVLEESEWPKSRFEVSEIPELKVAVLSLAVKSEEKKFPITDFSTLTQLTRVFAYCIRFIHNCRAKETNKKTGPLTLCELDDALVQLVKIAQAETFLEEIRVLKNGGQVKSSKIQMLSPFISEKGVLCVGGRIKNSPYAFEKKHPMLLNGNDHLAKLIVIDQHSKLLHAGAQQMLFTLRERFWITSGRSLCKGIVRNCIKCFRAAPKLVSPMMGNLPESRVVPSSPFTHTGIDFAGPFSLKMNKGRGGKTIKCYIGLFVCFSTKAVHLELVSSLSTEAFLMTLKRFVARRGRPSVIYTDNGKNFVGANSTLREIVNFLKTNDEANKKFALSNGIRWKFIPSYSPHFGGLWESAIKRAKHHLKRVVGNVTLTFEEFSTLLHQVESVLNSRPLSPMSSDPADLDPLTPGHFLIGKSLQALPERNVSSVPSYRLSRYEHLQTMTRHFWERWSTEYVGELQRRTKWTKNVSELKLGSMVLLKRDGLPPLNWRVGRVVEVFPGKDDITRVASVRTATGTYRRSFANICPLPLENVWSQI